MKYLKLFEEYTIEDIIYLQTKLDFSSYSLISLKGIEKYKNLQELYVSNNKLTSLEGIQHCKELIELNCCNNPDLECIEQIYDLPKLEYFYCDDTKIRDLIPEKFLQDITENDPSWLWDDYYLPMIVTEEFQREFLTKHLDRINMLLENLEYFRCDDSETVDKDDIRIHPNIMKEVSHLLDMKGIGL